MNLKDLIIKLKENDYRLILAHPERYSMVQNNFNLLYELKELGVLLQSNYGSILGIYGETTKKTLKKMLKEDLKQKEEFLKRRHLLTKTVVVFVMLFGIGIAFSLLLYLGHIELPTLF